MSGGGGAHMARRYSEEAPPKDGRKTWVGGNGSFTEGVRPSFHLIPILFAFHTKYA